MTMSNTLQDTAGQHDDQDWEPGDDEPEMPVSGELLADADEPTPEEAGYGYGV
jgi:hypothetical protein